MSYSKSYEPEGYGQQPLQATATTSAQYNRDNGQQVGAQGQVDNIPVMVQPHQAGYGGNVPPAHMNGIAPGMDPYAPRQRRQPPPLGKWADGICDWPSNIYPSMYCTCCVCGGAWILGQISEKVGCLKFKYTIGIYTLFCIIALIIQLVDSSSNALFWLPQLYIFIHIIAVRMHIVKHHQIQECSTNPGCAAFGECCWAFWCTSCSLCQMARYVYGYDQVFDGDGDPYRGDNWAV